MIDRNTLAKAGAGSVFFLLIGLWGITQDETPLTAVGWLSIVFGTIGAVATFLQFSGLWQPAGSNPKRPAQLATDATLRAFNSDFDLSPAKKSSVRKVLASLCEAGLFPSGGLKVEHLFEAVADQDCPVKQDTVLTALHEAGYYHSDFSAEAAWVNLAFHSSHSEQFTEAIESQLEDLVRLANGALIVEELKVDLDLKDGPGLQLPCAISMKLNGKKQHISYRPAGKYLSTHVHVALARGLREKKTARRLAWLWDDQGVWITCLAEGKVEQLNAGAGALKGSDRGWRWIDEEEPFAAGEV